MPPPASGPPPRGTRASTGGSSSRSRPPASIAARSARPGRRSRRTSSSSRPPRRRRRRASARACAAGRRRRRPRGVARHVQHGDAGAGARSRRAALDGVGIEALADRLGVGERQLRRLFRQHLGASPIAVAQTRRVLLAKHLIDQTRLPMAQVALAAGFGSIRRFNETFQRLYGRPPSTLRRGGAGEMVRTGDVSILLPYRPPYDWPAMLAFLGARAIPGVEAVTCDTYTRTIAIGGVHGTVTVQPHERPCARGHDPVPRAARRCRRSSRGSGACSTWPSDPELIGAHLAEDPDLAPRVARPARAARGRRLGRLRARGPRPARAADHGGRRGAAGGAPGRRVRGAACRARTPPSHGLTHVFPDRRPARRSAISRASA